MELQIGKWGNSLALRLPVSLARQMGLEEGASMQAELLASGELRLRAGVNPARSAKTRAELAQELAAMHQDWPMGYPVVREMRDQD